MRRFYAREFVTKCKHINNYSRHRDSSTYCTLANEAPREIPPAMPGGGGALEQDVPDDVILNNTELYTYLLHREGGEGEEEGVDL